MDKTDFIDKAPGYYALAIISHLIRENSPTTQYDVAEAFSGRDEETHETYNYLASNRLFELALSRLTAENYIEIEVDDFAPAIIKPTANFKLAFLDFLAPPEPLYSKFLSLGRTKNAWLLTALQNIEAQAQKLGMTDKDYDKMNDEWQPLIIEHSTPEIEAIISATDEALEAIRADNGYAANRPHERDFVLDGLSNFSNRLKKSAAITLPYIKQYAIDPIKRATTSLGKSASGLIIEVVKTKIRNWLMKQGIPWPWEW